MAGSGMRRNPVPIRDGPATVTGESSLSARATAGSRPEGRGPAAIRESGDSGRCCSSHLAGADPPKGCVPVTPPYPFSAVVGLADLRLALLLTAVSPAI